ncbi:hypothetical protein SAMN04488058_104110 [Deinococcus reticulitermitis]|uniref:Uncharacterized protein n=1 Tax=Deinococcus reticulitermitis TaxID=856736 RepID=A0A1H6WE08_9DEIO|nr:hypothetical protein [Deinococcus reticulitermitis]SEJ13936.1 hypothetical protein SAMN04488058_104110 [Deinococcus reticulitermitis]
MAGTRRPKAINGERGTEGRPDPSLPPQSSSAQGEPVRIRPVRGAAAVSPGLTPVLPPPAEAEAGGRGAGGQETEPRPRSRQLTPHVRVQPRGPGEAAPLRAEPWPPLVPAPSARADEPSADEAARLQRALSDWLLHAPAPGGPRPSETPAVAPDSREAAPRQREATGRLPTAGGGRREVLRVTANPAPVERLEVGAGGGEEAGEPAAPPVPEAAAAPSPAPGRPAPVPSAPGEDLTPLLEPMFGGVAPFLARFLPRSAPQQLGLLGHFCPLDDYLGYLHAQHWCGYLQVGTGQLAAYALLYEGRVVAAATLGATGEEALGELLTLYKQGAPLSAYPLPPVLAHLLSGVGGRASRSELGADFTGVYADAEGALFYSRGEVVATISATLPVEGAFPAPARPLALGLPRSLAGWAYQTYALTLRGRDVDHPITSVYHEVRARYGEEGADLIRALGRGQTPAEYAAHSDRSLPELEKLLQEFAGLGLLRAPEA